jgi:hypothetical protein
MERALKVDHTFKIAERLDNSRGGSSFNSALTELKDLSAGKAIVD